MTSLKSDEDSANTLARNGRRDAEVSPMKIDHADTGFELLLRKPGLLWLEITPECDLKCLHCYSDASSRSKPDASVDWNKVLSDGFDVGYRRVQFIGGEPTLHPQLTSLIENADVIGYKSIEIFSNLTLLNEHLLDTLSKHNVSVATSLYGSNEKVHESITYSKGSFLKTVSGIKKVVERGLKVRVGIVVTELNKEGVTKTIDLLVSLGINKDNISRDHVRSVGRGEKLTRTEYTEGTLCGNCWKGNLAVSWSGKVYPCVFARQQVVGNIHTEELATIVSSEKLREFRRLSYNFWLRETKRGDCVPNHEDCVPESGPCGPDDREKCNPMSW